MGCFDICIIPRFALFFTFHGLTSDNRKNQAASEGNTNTKRTVSTNSTGRKEEFWVSILLFLFYNAVRNEDVGEFNQIENKLMRKDQKEQNNPPDIVLMKRQLTPEEIQEMK